MDINPNSSRRALLIVWCTSQLLHTFAYPLMYAVFQADHAGIPSFIRFFALFFGVFQCFQIHIRSLYPVSYTHLDVYKRQAFILSQKIQQTKSPIKSASTTYGCLLYTSDSANTGHNSIYNQGGNPLRCMNTLKKIQRTA